MDTSDVWAFALSLPQTTEEPHFESRSLRMRAPKRLA